MKPNWNRTRNNFGTSISVHKSRLRTAPPELREGIRRQINRSNNRFFTKQTLLLLRESGLPTADLTVLLNTDRPELNGMSIKRALKNLNTSRYWSKKAFELTVKLLNRNLKDIIKSKANPKVNYAN